ncbi:hypothetical protein M408DRAFT_334321 [Serendipita vermifera MAFF 305830]|uniref:Uncharacterized protein n=1 Tax=Serendipita vermifera MAFF 305830 TaxID=933852 RepID=A0A0C2WPT6_SERVB|nr:hypothetical protein M408DRAFT_334321 [Serendipita vermifera MAFF 305830]
MCTPQTHTPASYADNSKEYTVTLPGKHAAYLYGTVTAGWVQKVTATVVAGDTGAVLDKYVFEGTGNTLLTLTNTYQTTYSAAITPADKARKILLKFEAQIPDRGLQPSKVQHKENIVPKYAVFYTFYAEDGFDNDEHDTDFCISVLPTTKAG